MKAPNYFIIGAPRCGTTAMAKYLSEHPNIFMPYIKEPKFYCSDLRNRAVTSRRAYDRLYKDVLPIHQAVGEASASYAYSKVAVSALLNDRPDARLIFMVREPVAMARSLHMQLYRLGVENTVDFERAWELQEERRAGVNVPSGCDDPKRLQYGPICTVGQQLLQVCSHASREQVHVVFFDDLITDIKKVYQDILTFLGVADDGRDCFDRVNKKSSIKSQFIARLFNRVDRFRRCIGLTREFGLARKLSSLNNRPSENTELSPLFEQALRKYFHEDICLLESLTGRDLTHWNASEPSEIKQEC